MPKLELTHIINRIRQRFRLDVPATTLPRAQNGAVQDAAIGCDKATALFQKVKATTNLDGCPIWVSE